MTGAANMQCRQALCRQELCGKKKEGPGSFQIRGPRGSAWCGGEESSQREEHLGIKVLEFTPFSRYGCLTRRDCGGRASVGMYNPFGVEGGHEQDPRQQE